MENTVENVQGIVPDDAALTPVQETEAPVSELTEITEPEAPKEPGYVRKRIDAAVAKALQEQEQRLRAEFDQTLAPIRESVYERQADALVSSGEFKSKETALEYVKLKNGVSVSATPQQRDEKGRFAQEDPVARARANLLSEQAEKIRANRGLDVIGAYNNNPEIQQKVLSGEWDFYDVADNIKQQRVPAPMRSTNGASVSGVSIAQMTDAQFEQLQKNLAAGKTYR